MSYTNFDDLFQDLYEVNSPLTYENFSSSTMTNLSTSINDIWKKMLDKISQTPLGPFNEDVIGDNTVFGHINECIDYNSTIEEYNSNSFWNESVSQLANDFEASFLSDATLYGDVKIVDIKNADAGNSFNIEEQWVRPWTNKNNETYKVVRGNDVINAVIEYSNNLDYTNIKGNWTRLLMPQYLRYVEVEDLNRNFWVISEVLTGICDFIFGDKLKPLLDSIINELIQLWQNVQYLWGMYTMLSQKSYFTDIHYEVVPIPIDNVRHYLKFDNFDLQLNIDGDAQQTNLLLENIWKSNLSYLKDQYVESNLCIVPVIRNNNYEHNYYETEYYPGIFLYDRNINKTRALRLEYSDNSPVIINAQIFGNFIGLLSKDGTQYAATYSDPPHSSEELPLYSLLRTEPLILSAKYVERFTEINFQLRIRDAATEIKTNQIETVCLIDVENNNLSNYTSANDFSVVSQLASKTSPSTLNQIPVTNIIPLKGFYMGELSSSLKILEEQPVSYNLTMRKLDANNESQALKDNVTVTVKDEQNNVKYIKTFNKNNTYSNFINLGTLNKGTYKISETSENNIYAASDNEISITIKQNGVLPVTEQEITKGGFPIPLKYNCNLSGNNIQMTIKNPRTFSSAMSTRQISLKPFVKASLGEPDYPAINIDTTNYYITYADNLKDLPSQTSTTQTQSLSNLKQEDANILRAFMPSLNPSLDSALVFYYGYHTAGNVEPFPSDSTLRTSSFKSLNREGESIDVHFAGGHSAGFNNIGVLKIAGQNNLTIYDKYNSPLSYPNIYAFGQGSAGTIENMFFFIKASDNDLIKKDNWFLMLISGSIANFNNSSDLPNNANAYTTVNEDITTYHMCPTITITFFFPQTSAFNNYQSLGYCATLMVTRQDTDDGNTVSASGTHFYDWSYRAAGSTINKSQYKTIVEQITNGTYKMFQKALTTGTKKDLLKNAYGNIDWNQEDFTGYTYYTD